jgi:hypothetical protein
VAGGLRFLDEDGTELVLDAGDATALLDATGGLDGATVSACPDCGCRVLAAVALVDLLEGAGPEVCGPELTELAEDAPTLHVYVVDETGRCRHRRWRDPLAAEWSEAVDAAGGPRARP